MRIVIYEISTSLDGFTTATDQTSEEPMGAGGEQLFGWTSDGEEGKQLLAASGQRTGASIAGREPTTPPFPGGEPTGQVVSCAHPPSSCPTRCPEGGVYTFVKSPLEAVAAARQVAGDRSIDVFSASIGNQLLQAGAVDEIHLYVAPVLFGSGTHLFESLPRHVQLERLEVQQTAKTTYLRYRVVSG